LDLSGFPNPARICSVRIVRQQLEADDAGGHDVVTECEFELTLKDGSIEYSTLGFGAVGIHPSTLRNFVAVLNTKLQG
jgi:hypothetical protein